LQLKLLISNKYKISNKHFGDNKLRGYATQIRACVQASMARDVLLVEISVVAAEITA